jgi:hypothetical protein
MALIERGGDHGGVALRQNQFNHSERAPQCPWLQRELAGTIACLKLSGWGPLYGPHDAFELPIMQVPARR